MFYNGIDVLVYENKAEVGDCSDQDLKLTFQNLLRPTNNRQLPVIPASSMGVNMRTHWEKKHMCNNAQLVDNF